MLYNVKGKLTVSDVNFIVVECGGVGFKCFTTLNTVKNIGKIGDEVNVFTYLVTVSGIGPKAAAAILSELSPDRLAICIASGDAKSITKAQGVGKKTAERVVLELKDKMGAITVGDTSDAVSSVAAVSESSNSSEAVEALVALGYSQSDAAVVVGSMDKSLSVDEMIRHGLKQLAKKL